MRLRYRPARREDFAGVYRMWLRKYGRDPKLVAGVAHEWNTLIQNPMAVSVIVEDEERPEPDRIVGYGLAVFVTDAFVRWARADMPPFLNVHATQPMPDGSWPLLDYEGVVEANSGEGLNVLLAHWGWVEPPLTPEEAPHVREMLDRNFFGVHAGYNIKEILVESDHGKPLEIAGNGGFRIRRNHNLYARENPPPKGQSYPVLLGATREEALTAEGLKISRLFLYNRPRIYFSEYDQQVLREAVRGRPDEEIAELLNITEGAVKKRWLGIFERVDAELPGLIPQRPLGRRGQERRSKLIDYLREHPEELRPVRRPPNLSMCADPGDRNGPDADTPQEESAG